jgi:uncharacterized membrane protein YbhN (UPF0104 family)
MTALWAVGLWLYTYVYTCSLPGLRHPQALALNLTGSLVSNVLPFGGAAGVATTYGLTRSWGFANVATSLMVLVSGLANLLIRLLLALVGLVAALATGAALPAGIQRGLIVTIAGLGLVVAALVAALANARFAVAAGHALDVATAWVRRTAGRPPHPAGARRWLDDLQERSRSVLVTGWPGIAMGMVGYYATEALLLGVALRALGSDLSWAGVVAAFALSRVLTAAVITPSGTGISEAGTAALLVFLGVPTAAAAAAVLVLYFYTYLIEIPAGLAGWAWVWAMRKRWGGAAASQALEPLPTPDPHPSG